MKLLVLCALLVGCNLAAKVWAHGAHYPSSKILQSKSLRPVIVTLRSGEKRSGNLVKVDDQVVELTVENALQIVKLDDVMMIEFAIPSDSRERAQEAQTDEQGRPIYEAGKNGVSKPVILYKEKPKYTKDALDNGVEGTVVLSLVFAFNGRISAIRVIRGLPHGLTESAIEAAQKIKFEPAKKDGEPVNVRVNVEFTFNL